ncbi:MAG: hypothetical protein WDW36_000730 [Sanguina aurantia]
MTARFVLLGAAQDAGVPQIACVCTNCRDVREGRAPAQWAVCGALLDDVSRTAWLIDCGPDIKQQWDLLQLSGPGYRLEGVLLTHLHMGHYFGLAQFGKEALNLTCLKVGGSRSVCDFLRSNQPWATCVSDGNFDLQELAAGQRYPLSGSAQLSVTPVPVPHRSEYSDCVAYHCHGPTQQVLYLPDIDSWEAWDASSSSSSSSSSSRATPSSSPPLSTTTPSAAPDTATHAQHPATATGAPDAAQTRPDPVGGDAACSVRGKHSAVRSAVSAVDVAFLDACFFDAPELPPGRAAGSIPHPLVVDTLAAMAGLERKVVLIHMNHNSSLWRKDSKQYQKVVAAGVRVGEQGAEYPL